MDRLASAIFHNFWKVLTVVCAIGEWAVVVLVLGLHVSLAQHLLLLLGLLVLNYAATGWCERERHVAPFASRLGQLTLAVGFGSFLTTGILALTAIVWWGWLLAVPAARAGVVALPLDPWAGFPPLVEASGLLGFSLVAWGYLVGPRWVRTTRRTVPIVGLPQGFDGYTIAHLSDLHLGTLADRRTLGAAFDRVTMMDVDLVCITGDLVDSAKSDLRAWIPELRRLRARDGVLAILGNHDRDSDAEAVATAVTTLTSVRLLRDEIATITRGNGTLAIIGLEDRRPPHCAAALPALAKDLPAQATPVLLVHHPNAFPDAVSAGIPLTLAGHTHGGQLAVPFFRHLNVSHALVTPYDVGWFRTETHRLHVSAGLGSSGQPLRIGTRPEITIITLARDDRAPSVRS